LQSDADNRSQNRSNVFLSASLLIGTASVPVRVRNMSQRGALLEASSLPSAGTKVRLARGELRADGNIAWKRDGQAGIRFASEIDVGSWVQKVGHTGQQRVDNAIAALRRHEAVPDFTAQAPSLERIGLELQVICDRLTGSPTMTVEFGEELVKLDTIAQTLRQLAGEVTA
jgi:hypothetical protein